MGNHDPDQFEDLRAGLIGQDSPVLFQQGDDDKERQLAVVVGPRLAPLLEGPQRGYHQQFQGVAPEHVFENFCQLPHGSLGLYLDRLDEPSEHRDVLLQAGALGSPVLGDDVCKFGNMVDFSDALKGCLGETGDTEEYGVEEKLHGLAVG
jgi:hypothetical protein